ncbi:hypothetical protein SCUCBS95973_004052 [Sporothrix curviconia]|uniref:Chromosome segregation protein n=1 Tax=Sporothrix curviconia TaxID=1260050 RepID=A0ABP0BLN3_9PEZI
MDVTGYGEQYFVYDNRLASFQGPQPVAKRRPSAAAGSRAPKALTWPHKSPAPIDLARAGFYFNPQPSNPDNVRCFLCHKDLDGWEEEDDPLQEHLKHSGSCGWAICAAIELELGDVVNEDPRLPYLLDARKSTFAGRWPYESKKGWKCKTKQLAEAGWKYTPTLESDDNTTCTYCQLALDGWESGDKPMDEHQRRSPNCPFFTLISQNPPPKKTARGKATRTSKAARLSVQSVATIQSDAQSLADPDESILTTATVVTAGGRKTAASRSRKTATGAASTTAKGRKTRAKKDESVPVPEPEHPAEKDNIVPEEEETTVTETQPPAPAPVPTKPTRGKKRTSEEVDPANAFAEEAPAPKKKRTTRVRASNNSVQAESANFAMFDPAPPTADESAIEAELRALERDMDVDMDRQLQEQLELEQEQEKELQVPKKGRKAGTRKVSKQTRKTKEAAAVVEDASEVQLAELGAVAEPAPSTPQVEQAPAPEPEPEVQQLPEPPTPEPVPDVKHKAKAKPKTKKMSLPPREPSKPRLSLQELEDLEGPDELHEDSFVSATSTNTVVREAPEPEEPEEPVAPAPPAKKGRGRPSKKSTESARSSAAARAAEAAAQPGAPTKITPIPPPSIPAMTMTVELPAPKRRKSSGAAKAEPTTLDARKSQTDIDKALPPLPKTKQQPKPHASLKSVSAVPVPAVAHTASPAPATPRKQRSPVFSAKQATISPSQSPQSSDAENQPPSSRPATTSASKGKRVALAPMQIPPPSAAPATPGGVSTPVQMGSPSKRANTIGGLRSAVSWSAVDVDAIFGINKENGGDVLESLLRKGTDLTTPEKAMTVEEFIFHNASQAEWMLKEGCETMVSVFEQQGSQAMRVLESLEVEE